MKTEEGVPFTAIREGDLTHTHTHTHTHCYYYFVSLAVKNILYAVRDNKQLCVCVQPLCSKVWNMPTLSSSTTSSTPETLWRSCLNTWWETLLLICRSVSQLSVSWSVTRWHLVFFLCCCSRQIWPSTWSNTLEDCTHITSGSVHTWRHVWYVQIYLYIYTKYISTYQCISAYTALYVQLLLLLLYYWLLSLSWSSSPGLHVPAAAGSLLHPQPEDPPQRPEASEPAHQLPGRTQDGRLWWERPNTDLRPQTAILSIASHQ